MTLPFSVIRPISMEPVLGENSRKKREQIKPLNAYLDTVEAKVHEARHLLIQLGGPVTTEFIKDTLRGQKPTFEKNTCIWSSSWSTMPGWQPW